VKSADSLNNKDVSDILSQLNNRLSRIEVAIDGLREPSFSKEWYTISEAADILGRAAFTVREWARLDRINALKRPSGRGTASEWMISRKEMERIQNKGLLPRNM